MQASRNLAARGFRSQTQVLSDQASLDSAAAAVRQAEVALDQVNIRAPFAGVFDHRDAEVGAYLAPGQSCGTMVELDPLLIVGDMPETEAAKVKVGDAVTAKLVSGETIAGPGALRRPRRRPATTRTYRVEVTAANPGGKIRSGLSADIAVDAGAGRRPPGAGGRAGARLRRPPGRPLGGRGRPGGLHARSPCSKRRRRGHLGRRFERSDPCDHRRPVLCIGRPGRTGGAAMSGGKRGMISALIDGAIKRRKVVLAVTLVLTCCSASAPT